MTHFQKFNMNPRIAPIQLKTQLPHREEVSQLLFVICFLPTKVSSLIHISLTESLLVSFNSFRPSVGETNTTATTLHNSVEIKC